VGGEERPERRGNERRRHPKGRNAVKEPAERRLAAAAVAPSRERRPPALGRGRPMTPRAPARVRIRRREPQLHKDGHPERGGRGKVLGRASPGRPCRNGARGPAKPGAPADRRAGEPAGPFSSRRRTLSGRAAIRQCASSAPLRCSGGVAGRPAPQKGYGGTIGPDIRGRLSPFSDHSC